MTLNWALQVFLHACHRSQATMNTCLCQFLRNFGLFWPILLTNERFWCLSWPKFGSWTLSGSVHERHTSHCYGYSIYDPHITYPFHYYKTFDIESLYYSTYFLTYPLQTTFYLLKTQKLLSYLLCSIYYIFASIRVKGQHSRTCRVEHLNLYSNTFLKWQTHLKCFRHLKTALNHYINFGLSSMSCYIPINWNIVVMILTDVLPVYL